MYVGSAGAHPSPEHWLGVDLMLFFSVLVAPFPDPRAKASW